MPKYAIAIIGCFIGLIVVFLLMAAPYFINYVKDRWKQWREQKIKE